jgi:hypothetical protein
MSGQDANGHEYFPQLRKDLEHTLCQRLLYPKIHSYHLAMQTLGYSMFKTDWDFILATHGDKNLWHDSTTFLEAIVQSKLHPLINAIRTRHVVMVAPAFLDKKFLPFKVATWVDVPEKNSYLEMEHICSNIITESAFIDNPLVLLSCGMPAKPILHRVYDFIARSKHGAIWDFGSMWDPFAGRASRSPYMSLPSDYAKNYR